MKTIPMFAILLALGLGAAAGTARAQDYSPEAMDELRYMIEEEKLAGDVYRVFGALYPAIMPFQNIPRSEDMHFATLVAQAELAELDVSDLTGLGAGVYLDASLRTLYGQLVAQGGSSSFAALTVGRNIELRDIEDLTAARSLVPVGSTLYTAYGNLMNASNNHLNAFNKWLAMTPAPVPEPETYAMFIAGLGVIGGIARRRRLRHATV